MTATEQEGLRALLDWYRHVGVELFVDDAPRDRFAEHAQAGASAIARPSPVMAPEAPAGARPSLRGAPPGLLAADAARVALAAREAAAGAHTIDELRTALAAFDGCSLKTTATNLVFADGDWRASLMIVGEAPGADDDATGRPFAGPSGRLLDRMLAAIGLDRSSVYLTTAIPWRPPGGIKPTGLHLAACLPFVLRHVELVKPRWLVTFGQTSTTAFNPNATNLSKVRGKFTDADVGLHRVRVLPMVSPENLLQSPGQKRTAWADLRRLRRVMDDQEPASARPSEGDT